MKNAITIIPRSYYNLLVVLFILMCLGAKESMCAEENTTKNIPKKKSYILAGTGALICPALGHSYIGGDNFRRGLWYTASEISYGLLTVGSALSGLGGKSKSSDKAYYFLSWTIATHTISAVDALISVNKRNTNSSTKSPFIAMAGAAVFPVIGHGYIGGNNKSRGRFYSLCQILFSLQNKPEIGYAIRFISLMDSFISTANYNKSVANVSILPGKSSVKLMITKTF